MVHNQLILLMKKIKSTRLIQDTKGNKINQNWKMSKSITSTTSTIPEDMLFFLRKLKSYLKSLQSASIPFGKPLPFILESSSSPCLRSLFWSSSNGEALPF